MRGCKVNLEKVGLWVSKEASTSDCGSGDCCNEDLCKENWGIVVELASCDDGGGRGGAPADFGMGRERRSRWKRWRDQVNNSKGESAWLGKFEKITSHLSWHFFSFFPLIHRYRDINESVRRLRA